MWVLVLVTNVMFIGLLYCLFVAEPFTVLVEKTSPSAQAGSVKDD